MQPQGNQANQAYAQLAQQYMQQYQQQPQAQQMGGMQYQQQPQFNQQMMPQFQQQQQRAARNSYTPQVNVYMPRVSGEFLENASFFNVAPLELSKDQTKKIKEMYHRLNSNGKKGGVLVAIPYFLYDEKEEKPQENEELVTFDF